MPDESSIPSAPGQRLAVDVRAATADDLDPLERIENAAFTTDRLTRGRLRALLRSPSADVLVAEERGLLTGYCLVLTRRGSSAARLYSLAVDPRYSGRGLGQRLLAEAEQAATQRGAKTLRLEVRADNPAGLALYERNGYRQTGRCPGYYQDGAEAVRFERDISDRERVLARPERLFARSAA